VRGLFHIRESGRFACALTRPSSSPPRTCATMRPSRP
jgi:hypothetical protein